MSAPASPVDPVAGLERAITRGTYVACVIAILTAALLLLDAARDLSGVTGSWFDLGLAVLIGIAAVQVTLSARLRSQAAALAVLRAPSAGPPPVVSAPLLSRWKTDRDRVWVALATRDRSEGLVSACRGLIGSMNGLRNAGQLTPIEIANLDLANATLNAYGWLVAHTALGWSGWLLDHEAQRDPMLFGAAVETIQTVATEGCTFANNWVYLIRQAGVSRLGSGGRDEWARFRDPTNLLISEIGALSAETARERGSGIPFRQELVRDL